MVGNYVVIHGIEYTYSVDGDAHKLTSTDGDVILGTYHSASNEVIFKYNNNDYTLNLSNKLFTWYDRYEALFNSNKVATISYASRSKTISNTNTIIFDDLTDMSFDTSKFQVIIDNEDHAMTSSIIASDASLVNGNVLGFNVIEYEEIGELNAGGVAKEDAVTNRITYVSSLIKVDIVSYQYHYNFRSKLRMVISVESLTTDDYRLSYRFLDGAFLDSANPTNPSAYIYEGILTTDEQFADNTPPRAYLGQDDITTWNDISGNSYDAKLSGGMWNSDYDGYKGKVLFEPEEGNVYSTELYEGVQRDSFVNENYFSRTMFKANFTYQIEKEPLGLDKDNVMGIDLGVNNFATLVTTEGTPFIVDGRFLKNQIAFKCKKTAHYQSILNKQGIKKSNRIEKINNKFKNLISTFVFIEINE